MLHTFITVYGNAGTGFQADDDGGSSVGAGQWTTPFAGGYVVGCARYLVNRDRADPKVAVYDAHLSVRGVRVGQQMSAGQVIGPAGSTGNSSSPHLHNEIRIDG